MKRWSFLMITLLLSLFLVACNTTEIELPKSKEEYQAELRARLDELSQQIKELKFEVKQADGNKVNVKDLNQTIEELETQYVKGGGYQIVIP